MDFHYLHSLCSCCDSLLNFFLKPTLHPQLIFSHYLTHCPIHRLNESSQRTPKNTDSLAKTCARALLLVNAVMRHNATITFNSKPAFFIGPKTTCANFKLQLSTNHGSLNITSSIVIKIVSIPVVLPSFHILVFSTAGVRDCGSSRFTLISYLCFFHFQHHSTSGLREQAFNVTQSWPGILKSLRFFGLVRRGSP